jgi:KaiC/GvpD/RAD55 family RecA-like ATPase
MLENLGKMVNVVESVEINAVEAVVTIAVSPEKVAEHLEETEMDLGEDVDQAAVKVAAVDVALNPEARVDQITADLLLLTKHQKPLLQQQLKHLIRLKFTIFLDF